MSNVSRRKFLEGALTASAVVLAPACSSSTPSAGAAPSGEGDSVPPAGSAAADGALVVQEDGGADGRAPTPSCEDPTDDDPEGPYYMAGAPRRTTLVEAGMPGTRLVIRGRVLAAGGTCAALGGAEVDVWQANDAGDYDNVGFTLRGVFVADANGAYQIETIVPGRYLNSASYRPRHVHVIVRAPGRPKLTTQLYFEGDPFNASDGMFKDSLVIAPKEDGAGGQMATFDFVLA